MAEKILKYVQPLDVIMTKLFLFKQGERLSHAVGCAFTACLQRKQKAQALQQQHKEVRIKKWVEYSKYSYRNFETGVISQHS